MSDIFNPQPGIFRTIFLYVGQGDATLMMIPDGNSHRFVLIDSNKDEKNGGIDIAKFLKGKIPNGELIFINTHPHKDHVRGIDEIKDLVGEVWETGFKPSSEHDEAKKIIDKLVSEKDTYYLRGTNSLNTLSTDGTEDDKGPHRIGDVDYQILSPFSRIADEVNGDDAKIHEQCGVIKFIYGNKSILITGDSDKKAWDNIAGYHKESLKNTTALSASHHGSITFFGEGEGSSEDHLRIMHPKYLVISAPKKNDSPHGHPDPEAVRRYKNHTPKDNIYHLGEKEQSVMVDIDLGGKVNVDWVNKINNKKPHQKNDDFGDNVFYSAPAKSKIYSAK